MSQKNNNSPNKQHDPYYTGTQIVRRLEQRQRSFKDWLLDTSIYFSFDASGFKRHALKKPTFPPLQGHEHVIVTGANSGVGYALTQRLMMRGVRVTMICRSAQRGIAAQQSLKAHCGNEPALYLADITDLNQIDKVCAQIKTAIEVGQLPPITCLVHNAGFLPQNLSFTMTGHELTVGAHLIGPTRMTAKLLSSFSDYARIIFMSSGGMYFAPLDVEAMLRYTAHSKQKFDGVFAYALSKRAQVELAKHMHLQLQKHQYTIDVQSIHPGWADTPGVESGLKNFHTKMSKKLRTSDQGAQPTEWLSCLPPLDSSYFWFDWAPRSPYLLGKRPTQSTIDALWTMVCEGASLSRDWIS